MATDFGPIPQNTQNTAGSGHDFGPMTLDHSMAALSHSQMTLDKLRTDAATAKTQADAQQSPLAVAGETAKSTVGTIAKSFVEPFARLGANVVNAGKQALHPLTPQNPAASVNIPGFGETKPVGQEGDAVHRVGDALVTGAEVGSTVAGETKAVGKIASYLGARAAKKAEEKVTQTAVKALTPKMTPTEIIEAGKAGQATTPRFGAPKIDMSQDKNFMKQVEATKGLVQGKSAIQDTNTVRDALGKEADALKSRVVASGKDRIFPFKELNATIEAAPEPISLKGTPFEKQIAPLKKAAVDIAKKNGGTISSLFDTRKEFDQLVEKTWPNLYESENAPMRNAVTAVRDAMNTFIDKNLPEDVGFRDSLGKQTTYYRAIDNIASKIPDEIKGSATFAKRHPAITNTVKYGGEAIGAGAMYEGAKKIGVPLP